MQEINNFCKKMQNYFVMSKKMPTFAPSKVHKTHKYALCKVQI